MMILASFKPLNSNIKPFKSEHDAASKDFLESYLYFLQPESRRRSLSNVKRVFSEKFFELARHKKQGMQPVPDIINVIH